jgi:protein SCO1/2
MVPKAVLVVVAIFSWLVTAAITVTVLTNGTGNPRGANQAPTELETVSGETPEATLPRYDLMPVFTLTDQDGQPYGLNDLRGKVWVVDTIFTRCNAVCPTLAAGMKQIQSALKLNGQFDERVRLISISVDGGHDTPGVLKQYAKGYQAEPGRWIFLTGERDVVWPLISDGLRLAVGEPEADDEMAVQHSSKLVLIDRAGVIRGYYDGLNEAGRIELLADLSRLLDEG